ncbi:alpha/beta hydrolase [Maricaulis sp.]|uniref:alpha/beta fold hydrolase n=1 Tax=Maricaulis sp. TaxID=1486257 RepID=UPI00260BB67D|nr:alpha/beta hydrolase [Maricaulis sp.]
MGAMSGLMALGALGLILALSVLLAGFIASRTHKAIEEEFGPDGEFITVNGTRMHYRHSGDKTLPAVLVLHGAASNLEEPYAALGDTLADHHMIWLDRPGLGWSERPDGPWNPEREAGLIMAFLTAIGVEQVTILGHSWGGAIAMRTALDHPARVRSLVLIAPALSAWIGEAAWFNKASFWPGFGPLISRLIVPLTGKGQMEKGAINAFHPEPVPADYSKRTKLNLLLRPHTWLYNAADMRDVNLHLEQQEPHYHRIEQRTIILAGKADTVLWSHRHSGVTASRMPRGELRYIKDAGHNLHHHRQADVAQAIREAIDEAEALSNVVEIADRSA